MTKTYEQRMKEAVEAYISNKGRVSYTDIANQYNVRAEAMRTRHAQIRLTRAIDRY